ncbi:hypothetical protein SD10_04135 [Spirosoma radiotolerans]|uniref:Uncharacterized protein n=1 Tax=Spirosoma radiotolerans TaxID=1379870 RepID=A0A0E3ZTZ0_9BACT|nr:hypothetical protein SD10_04135 [Spirosoma radiotolerans]
MTMNRFMKNTTSPWGQSLNYDLTNSNSYGIKNGQFINADNRKNLPAIITYPYIRKAFIRQNQAEQPAKFMTELTL